MTCSAGCRPEADTRVVLVTLVPQKFAFFPLVCPSLLHAAVSWERSQQLGALKALE